MIKLKDLLNERQESWCFNEEFLEFVDYLERWQSHATYRGVNIDKLVRSFNKIPKEAQREIQADSREVNNSYSAIDMDSLYDTNKVKVLSFTNKAGAEYFGKMVTGNPVVSGKHIKKYKLAISYPKVVKLCGNVGVGDDEGEILVIEPEFDKKWLRDYWEEVSRKAQEKRRAKDRANEFNLEFNELWAEEIEKNNIEYTTGTGLDMYNKKYKNPIIKKASDEIKDLKPSSAYGDDGLSEKDVSKVKSRIIKALSNWERKAKETNVKEFFKSLMSRVKRDLKVK